jgi:hydroxymethylpyrimidine pyrophosphatase-like HAD family hydrolase
MKNNKSIFIDIDNTLLTRTHKNKVSQSNIDAIKSAQKRDIYTVLTTGRGMERLPHT